MPQQINQPPRYVLFNDGTTTHHDDPETNLMRIQHLELEHHKQVLNRRFSPSQKGQQSA